MADLDYKGYGELVKYRLEADGFEVKGLHQVDRYAVDLFAFKHFQLPGANVSCWLAHLDNVDLQAAKNFSGTMFKLAKWSVRGYVVAIPALASSDFDEETKEYARAYKGFHTAHGVEHPVLVELKTRQIFHYDKKPAFFGRIPYGLAIDFTTKHLSTT